MYALSVSVHFSWWAKFRGLEILSWRCHLKCYVIVLCWRSHFIGYDWFKIQRDLYQIILYNLSENENGLSFKYMVLMLSMCRMYIFNAQSSHLDRYNGVDDGRTSLHYTHSGTLFKVHKKAFVVHYFQFKIFSKIKCSINLC